MYSPKEPLAMKSFFFATGRAAIQAGSPRWLLIACAVWLLASAGWRPLMLPDEGRYVGIAWEMLNSGNWLVPTLDGMPFFHKPPLFYWITTAALQLFGAHAWVGRLASVLPAIAAIIAVHIVIRHHRDVGTANLTAVILATQPFFFGATQFANLDMLVASMITLTILCVAEAAIRIDKQLSGKHWLAAGYVFAALGMLAKGLIGLLLPAAVIFVWLALRGKLRVFFRLLSLPLTGLLLLIAAPWFVVMSMKFPEFLDYFFIEQHFKRFASAGFNNEQGFWFYVPVLLSLTFPWSLWSIRLFRHRTGGKANDTDGLRMLMLVWTVIIIAVFSIPQSKLIGYILPVLPPFAFLLADSAKRWRDSAATGTAEAWMGASIIASSALCASLIAYMYWHDPSQLSHLAVRDERSFRRTDQVVMLDHYPYDLPFYLRSTTPAWVVGNWEDPSITKTDNWRKELADAGRFDPQARQDYLITSHELIARLCARRDRTYWIWGKRDAPGDKHWLSAAEQVFSNKKFALWRFRSDASKLSGVCDEKPSND